MTLATLAARLRVLISIGLVLAVWQLVYLAGVVPEKYFPSNAPDLQVPAQTGIHVISYKSSQ